MTQDGAFHRRNVASSNRVSSSRGYLRNRRSPLRRWTEREDRTGEGLDKVLGTMKCDDGVDDFGYLHRRFWHDGAEIVGAK